MEVKSFLRHLGYYRRFIKIFAKISYPLDRLTCKGESFRWEKEQDEAFEGLKVRLATTPILAYSDWNKEFHVYVDASKYAIGATLVQTGSHWLDHPIYFASRLLSKAEQNYSRTEREALGMVYAMQNFRHYLLGTPFVFYVDHQALLYMVNKPVIQGRISRWLLLLQEFTFKIIVRPGKKHVSANHLSRLRTGEPTDDVNDDFPNAQLFQIVVLPKWYTSIGEYLSTRQFPSNMPPNERRKLVLRSECFN